MPIVTAHVAYVVITRRSHDEPWMLCELRSRALIMTQWMLLTSKCRLCALVPLCNPGDVTRYKDDVIKWKHFPRYWPFVRGIHRSPVNSPHKGQWRGALMFSLICAWINDWVNNGMAGNLRSHRAHCDVSVMTSFRFCTVTSPIVVESVCRSLFWSLSLFCIYAVQKSLFISTD